MERIEHVKFVDGHGLEALDHYLERVRTIPLRVLRVRVTWQLDFSGKTPPCLRLHHLMAERFRVRRCPAGPLGCSSCRDPERCDYGRVVGGEELRMEHASARAYWIRGVPSVRVRAGESAVAELVTIDGAVPAAEALGECFVEAVKRLGAAAGRPNEVEVLPDEVLPPPAADPATDRAVRITARTAFRAHNFREASQNRCPALPELSMLLTTGVRHVAALACAYGGAAPQTTRVWLPSLAHLTARDARFHKWACERFSRHQPEGGRLSGYLGSAVIEGDAVPTLLPLLRVLAVTGVGLSTELGLGHFEVETLP